MLRRILIVCVFCLQSLTCMLLPNRRFHFRSFVGFRGLIVLSVKVHRHCLIDHTQFAANIFVSDERFDQRRHIQAGRFFEACLSRSQTGWRHWLLSQRLGCRCRHRLP